MILYHGSFSSIEKPDLLHSRENVDFGKGFYTTIFYKQAVKWALKFKNKGLNSVVSYYGFNTEELKNLKILKFDKYSISWLNFVISCRKQKDRTDYDLVIGGIANDKVFNTIELFFGGLISKREAIKRLKYKKPNIQYCFRTEKALNLLKFKKSVSL